MRPTAVVGGFRSGGAAVAIEGTAGELKSDIANLYTAFTVLLGARIFRCRAACMAVHMRPRSIKAILIMHDDPIISIVDRSECIVVKIACKGAVGSLNKKKSVAADHHDAAHLATLLTVLNGPASVVNKSMQRCSPPTFSNFPAAG